MGLEPEVEEGAVCGKALEAFRDLASTLNLPGEVSVAQLKGAVEALKAGASRLVKAEEAVQALKVRLARETADRFVEEALKAGKVSPAQRGWALEYCRRDPKVSRPMRTGPRNWCPPGRNCSPQEDHHDERRFAPGGTGRLPVPERLSEAYLKAKAQTA